MRRKSQIRVLLKFKQTYFQFVQYLIIVIIIIISNNYCTDYNNIINYYKFIRNIKQFLVYISEDTSKENFTNHRIYLK